MPESQPQGRFIRFGLFEVDLSARELRRDGAKLKIQDRPFDILTILLERPSEIVSREEFRKRLWPSDTFVDFDHSLNTAINKLRQCLGDDVESPRFIATAGRHGYRFIAPASGFAPQPPAQVASSGASAPLSSGEAVRVFAWRSRGTLALFAGCLAVIVVAFVAVRRYGPPPIPRVLNITRISHETYLDPWGRFASDGARFFFLDRQGDHWNLMQVPTAGGDAEPFPGPMRNVRISDVSPDRSKLLVLSFSLRGPDLPVWLIPVVGGPPRRVGSVIADDAVFAPSGQQIYLNKADGIYFCDLDGSHSEKLVSLPARSSYPHWDKEGRRLRFTVEDPATGATSIWEVSSKGTGLHQILPNWSEPGNKCCGIWTPDGNYFIFQTAVDNVETLWTLRDRGSALFSGSQQPQRLTFGQESYGHPVAGASSNEIFAWGGGEVRQLFHYDRDSGRLDPLFPSAQTNDLAYSNDGAWVAFATPGMLWRSKIDGSERQPVVSGFPQITAIHWSSDNKRILFCGGRYWVGNQKFYAASVDGGSPIELPLGGGQNEPAWGPGGSVVFAKRGANGSKPDPNSGIYSLNLETSAITKIPGSNGFVHVAWSPDGRYLAAVTSVEELGNPVRFELYDSKTGKWKEIMKGVLLDAASWTPDSKSFFFQDILGPNQPVYRYFVDGRKPPELAFDFASLIHDGYIRCAFNGFAPDGSVIALLTKGNADLYRLELELP